MSFSSVASTLTLSPTFVGMIKPLCLAVFRRQTLRRTESSRYHTTLSVVIATIAEWRESYVISKITESTDLPLMTIDLSDLKLDLCKEEIM